MTTTILSTQQPRILKMVQDAATAVQANREPSNDPLRIGFGHFGNDSFSVLAPAKTTELYNGEKIRAGQNTEFYTTCSIVRRIAASMGSPLRLDFNGQEIEVRSNSADKELMTAFLRKLELVPASPEQQRKGVDHVISNIIGSLDDLLCSAIVVRDFLNTGVGFEWADGAGQTTLFAATRDKTAADLYREVYSEQYCLKSFEPRNQILEIDSIADAAHIESLAHPIMIALQAVGADFHVNIRFVQGKTLDLNATKSVDEVMSEYRGLFPTDMLAIRVENETDFSEAAKVAIQMAQVTNRALTLYFNVYPLALTPASTVDDLRKEFSRSLDLFVCKDGHGSEADLLIRKPYGDLEALCHTAVAVAKIYDRRVNFFWPATDTHNIWVTADKTRSPAALLIEAKEKIKQPPTML